ncbi:hypothetical protein MAR_026064, partial [Mya arenaria]
VLINSTFQWGIGVMDRAADFKIGVRWFESHQERLTSKSEYGGSSLTRMPGVRLSFQCVQLIHNCLPIELKDTDVLCNKCRIKHFYKLSPVENFDNKLIDQSDNEEYQPPVSKKTSFASPPSVRLNIPSTPKSHSRCFICKRPGPKLIVVPSEARFTAFVQRNVIIKSGTRCCPVHMDESQIKDEALQSVKASESAFVNRATVLELLNKLRASCNKTQKRFDFNTLNNEEYVDLTGLNKEAIRDICAGVEGHIRNTPVRDILTTCSKSNRYNKTNFNLKNNDAKILNHIINTNVEDIKSYVHPCDIFVVDRGFRDSLQLLEDLGIQSKMPSFLPKGETQFQTEVANTSRLVTKVPFIGDFVQIICAVCNKYLPPLSSSCSDDDRLAVSVKYRNQVYNIFFYICCNNALEVKYIIIHVQGFIPTKLIVTSFMTQNTFNDGHTTNDKQLETHNERHTTRNTFNNGHTNDIMRETLRNILIQRQC